jgi:hypothetical protein
VTTTIGNARNSSGCWRGVEAVVLVPGDPREAEAAPGTAWARSPDPHCRHARRRDGPRTAAALLLAFLAGLVAPPAKASFADLLPDRLQIGRMAIAYDDIAVTLRRVELAWRPAQPIAISVDRIEGPPGTLPLWASARLRPAARAGASMA